MLTYLKAMKASSVRNQNSFQPARSIAADPTVISTSHRRFHVSFIFNAARRGETPAAAFETEDNAPRPSLQPCRSVSTRCSTTHQGGTKTLGGFGIQCYPCLSWSQDFSLVENTGLLVVPTVNRGIQHVVKAGLVPRRPERGTRRGRLTARVIVLALALVLVRSDNAYAYIDPSTSSYLFQWLLAGILAAAFALRMFWRNLRGLFRRLFLNDRENSARNKE